jgi:hypothetical protein
VNLGFRRMSEHRSEAEERSSNKQSASPRGGAEGAPRSERVLGDVGTRLLFENHPVRTARRIAMRWTTC